MFAIKFSCWCSKKAIQEHLFIFPNTGMHNVFFKIMLLLLLAVLITVSYVRRALSLSPTHHTPASLLFCAIFVGFESWRFRFQHNKSSPTKNWSYRPTTKNATLFGCSSSSLAVFRVCRRVFFVDVCAAVCCYYDVLLCCGPFRNVANNNRAAESAAQHLLLLPLTRLVRGCTAGGAGCGVQQ